DRAGVAAGRRLLDVGCGYGRLLKAAAARGARAWGITISPEQVRRGTAAGLNVRLRDYRQLGPEGDGQFDAVIANGSLEHPAAAAGRDDEVYRDLFGTVYRPLSAGAQPARFVTTAIHFRRRPAPADLLRPPGDFPAGSAGRHWALLARSFGGWYPVRGQLERC